MSDPFFTGADGLTSRLYSDNNNSRAKLSHGPGSMTSLSKGTGERGLAAAAAAAAYLPRRAYSPESCRSPLNLSDRPSHTPSSIFTFHCPIQ